MKLKVNKKILLITVLTVVLFIFNLSSQALAAANPMTIMTINGSILPEYDNKYLLQLYTITMTNTSDKPFSGELTWRIPKNAQSIFVSRNEDLDKNQSIGSVRSFSDYDELYWTPKTPIPPKGVVNWHIEYYDTTAIQGNTDKNFTYTFKQPYKIEIASLVILQPTKATNFQLIPAPENTQQSQQGELFGYSIRNGQPNEEKTIKVNYTKTDPNPSFGSNSKTVAIGDNTGKIQGTTNSTTNSNNTLMYLLIALIIIISAVVIVLIKKQDQPQIAKTKRVKREELDSTDYAEEYNEDINSATIDSYQEVNPKIQKIKDKLKQEMLNGNITESEYYDKLLELE